MGITNDSMEFVGERHENGNITPGGEDLKILSLSLQIHINAAGTVFFNIDILLN